MKLINFRHSGALGDIIYSLPLVKKLSLTNKSNFTVVLNNCEKVCVEKYGYWSNEKMGAQFNSHLKTMTQESFDLLKPLLESQSYFNEVKCSLYTDPDPEILIDLDDFRHHFAKTIRDNYIACYFHSFKQQFTHEDTLPWMTIDNPIRIKPIVCSRTSRYRCPNGDQILKQLANEMNFKDNAVFLGTEEEYEDYKRVTNCNLLYHPVQDFLETARIIKGADQFIGNQTFTYSLAIAMGQATILETNKQTSLDQNECYFVRKNCRYF